MTQKKCDVYKKNVRQIYFVITFRSHPLLSQKLIEIKTITSAAEYIEVGRKDREKDRVIDRGKNREVKKL